MLYYPAVISVCGVLLFHLTRMCVFSALRGDGTPTSNWGIIYWQAPVITSTILLTIIIKRARLYMIPLYVTVLGFIFEMVILVIRQDIGIINTVWTFIIWMSTGSIFVIVNLIQDNIENKERIEKVSRILIEQLTLCWIAMAAATATMMSILWVGTDFGNFKKMSYSGRLASAAGIVCSFSFVSIVVFCFLIIPCFQTITRKDYPSRFIWKGIGAIIIVFSASFVFLLLEN